MHKIEELQQYLIENSFSQIFVLVDENTYKHCLPILVDKIDEISERQATILEIPSGEENKNFITVENICNSLLESHADRKSLLISLGGGVVTDMGGFVACIYKRGIQSINIPTTLLSMIDASIGGKTGIDLNGVKNAIGTFNHNTISFLDTDFLKTLSQRQIMNGVAEMLKTFLIADKDYTKLFIEKKDFSYIEDRFIERCIHIKETIVEKDFYEKEERKTLNLGHTLGHAFESYYMTKPQTEHLLHGEAVAIGLYYALKISEKYFSLHKDTFSSIYNFLSTHYKIPSLIEEKENISSYIKNDKKSYNNNTYFVLLKDIALPVINVEINDFSLFL
ncbi:MAG: 3-dehydroquinate synthase [Bacteroidales bacterium]|nr:3-dehydroquinate synthase [Bacteroidales bacterium]